MPAVQIRDDEKYGKAIGLLLRMGGLFRTRPTHVLLVGETQYQALVRAGLVRANGTKAGSRGQKKKTV
jgi:hypothetical protein